MTIGIVGLGLIGGSFAKAYKSQAGNRVYVHDIDEKAYEEAYNDGVCDGKLNKDTIGQCDLVLVALYPKASLEYISEMAPYFNSKTYVIDCCGTKRYICSEGFKLAKDFGFTFVGGHPMAGKHFSGYKYSVANLYHNASMIIVPEDLNDTKTIDKARDLLEPVKFGQINVCDANKHDSMIAFTSQMAHVVSNAYVKSPTAKEHSGFSAGSYKDLTRVAWLNETMWTELFMENKDNLIKELDYLTNSLNEYKIALQNNDDNYLKELLQYGKKCKEEVDGVME